jgi:hypothetical protein
MQFLIKWSVGVLAVAMIATITLAPSSCRASILLDLTPTGFSWNTSINSTTFDGRSIYIRANSTFAIDGIEWFGHVSAGSYDAVIWDGLGESSSLGAMLAVQSNVLPGGSLSWNRIPLSFTFQSGEEYLVNFRRSDGSFGFSSTFHYLDWGQGAQQSNLGIVTLLDGRHGFAPNSDNNSWTTHFRFTQADVGAVPELSSLAVWGLGMGGAATIAVFRRRNWRDRAATA